MLQSNTSDLYGNRCLKTCVYIQRVSTLLCLSWLFWSSVRIVAFFSLGFDSIPRSVKGLNPDVNLYWGNNPEKCEWPSLQSVSPFALISWGAWGAPVCWEDWLSHDEKNYFNKILIWFTNPYNISCDDPVYIRPSYSKGGERVCAGYKL